MARYEGRRKSSGQIQGSGNVAAAVLVAAGTADNAGPGSLTLITVCRVIATVRAAAATLILYRRDPGGGGANRELRRYHLGDGQSIDLDNLIGVTNQPNSSDTTPSYNAAIWYEWASAVGASHTVEVEYVG